MADCPLKFASRQGLAHDGLDPKVALIGRRARAPLSRIRKAIELLPDGEVRTRARSRDIASDSATSKFNRSEAQLASFTSNPFMGKVRTWHPGECAWI